MKKTIENNRKKGGFNLSGAAPRRGVTPQETQEH
jgi:hypothetical protein